MNHILYVQPIFIPNEYKFKQNINSLKSFNNYLSRSEENNAELTIVIGGWASSDELWNKLLSEVKQLFDGKITPIRFDKNYGKSIFVTHLVKMNKSNYNYIFTLDSDIIIPDDLTFMFERLDAATTYISGYKKIPFGVIALNQKEHCCHTPEAYRHSYKYTTSIRGNKFNEKIAWGKTSNGIAGGCLYISRTVWEKIGGYRTLGVYAGEDGVFMLDVRFNGYSYQIFETMNIIHPMEKDEKYIKWKDEMSKKYNASKVGLKLDSAIEETNIFWRENVNTNAG